MVYKLAAAAAFATVMSASVASATVYDFTGPGNGGNFTGSALDYGVFEVTASSGTLIPFTSTAEDVTRRNSGLGVRTGGGDNTQIDGETINAYEALTITFDYAVRLVSFDLGNFDGNDDYEVFIDGALVAYSDVATFVANVNNITSFTVVAFGGFINDGIFSGNDNFTLASIETASVPLPGAAGLLALGLGALGVARRSRRKAA